MFIFYFRPALFFKKQVIINFFSLNFTIMEIEGERVSSSQNERTLRREGVLENEQGPTGDWGGEGEGVKTREFLTKHTF